MQQPVQLGPKPLTRDDVHAVARGDARVEITEAAREAVTTARAHIERLATAEQPTYGVSTGFGALATRHIPPDAPGRSCSAPWSARTPRAPAPRSSARSCAR